MIRRLLLGLTAALSLTALAAPVLAETNATSIILNSACQSSDNAGACSSNTNDIFSSGLVRKIADIVVYAVALIAVIYLLIGAIRFAISAGDPKQVQEARETVMYAIIGIIVASIAYAAVHFVIFRVTNQPPAGCPGSTEQAPPNFDPSKCPK